MNKKVYLCDLEWTSLMKGLNIDVTPEDVLDKGGLKATIVFDDTIRYGELEKITKTKYFNITDENYKSRIDKAIEYIEKFEDIKAYYSYEENGYEEYNYDEKFKEELLNILRGVKE